MKVIQITYTVLKSICVPDDLTDDEIYRALKGGKVNG